MSRPAEQIDTIWIHCLATRPEWMAKEPLSAKVAEVTRWHTLPPPRGRGWKGIAYATIIDFSGEKAGGRDLNGNGDFYDEVGAGVQGHNARGVHIALVGGFGSNESDAFEQHFTVQQDLALRDEIRRIEEYCGRKLKVRGHNEVAAKACPGFNVARWYAGQPPRTMVQSSTLQAAGGGAAATAVGAVTAVSSLDGQAQLVAIGVAAVVVLAFGWIARERIREWARGHR